MRPDTPYFTAPLPDEEKRLIFKLKELIDDAQPIMTMEGSDEPKKWRGIKGLMKRMQNVFPYLITADTCIELCFEDTIGSMTYEMQGPLSYRLFIEALNSKETMDKHHEYIATHYNPIGSGDNQRATLRAEDMLLMLYSALRYELERHEERKALFVDEDDEAQAPAENVVRMPHFGMENSERAQQRWEAAYEWLADRKWLWRSEVDYHGWVYACCGQQKAPDGPIVWHGSTAALAYIIRTKFNGQWDIATKIFCLDKDREFPVSFNTTHNPIDSVTKSIDRAFLSANSH